MTKLEKLTDSQRRVYNELPATTSEIAEKRGIKKSSVRGYFSRINEEDNINIDWKKVGAIPVWYDKNNDSHTLEENESNERGELTDREKYIYVLLPDSVENIAEDLDVAEKVVEAHLDVIREKGWELENDEYGNYLGPDQDHVRNSEHKQTRTRKANKWWQNRHDILIHKFQSLQQPLPQYPRNEGNEDWVLHFTDLHVGDIVRRDDGRVVYDTAKAAEYTDYITEQSIQLSQKHGSEYDVAYILWGGDMVTNEGIYEGQFEDLDSWLDEQLEVAAEALLRQVYRFAEEFDHVEVVAQVGNHGDMRASATSRQANADLILYKWIRNVVSNVCELSEDHVFENVALRIGEAKNYRNFTMRDGKVNGHLRHGRDAKPQAQTASGRDKWGSWQSNWKFDIANCGHFHTSKREEANGKPIIFSGSPKPAAEYAESLGVHTDVDPRDIATTYGVSDKGLTAIFPIDTRHMGKV